MPCVYVLENKLNHKRYVGQTTKSFKKRIRSHKNENLYIDRSIKKNKIENFKIYVFYLPESLLDYFEIELIKKLNTVFPNGYNFTSGGNKNKHLSEATKRKISIKTKISMTEEIKKHLSCLAKNRKHDGLSDDSKKKISSANKGRKHTKEEKEKMKNNHLDFSYERNPRARKIICIEKNEKFNSIKEAEEKYKCSHISSVCPGKRNKAGGYTWKFC